MQTSTKIIIAGVLIALPIIIISAAGNKPGNAPGHAAPAHPPAPAGKCYGPADANCDNVVSKQEWLALAQINAERQFNEVDANHDGIVTREEGKAYRLSHTSHPRNVRPPRPPVNKAAPANPAAKPPAAAKPAAPAKP